MDSSKQFSSSINSISIKVSNLILRGAPGNRKDFILLKEVAKELTTMANTQIGFVIILTHPMIIRICRRLKDPSIKWEVS